MLCDAVGPVANHVFVRARIDFDDRQTNEFDLDERTGFGVRDDDVVRRRWRSTSFGRKRMFDDTFRSGFVR